MSDTLSRILEPTPVFEVVYYNREEGDYKGPIKFSSLSGARLSADYHAEREEVGAVEIWRDDAPNQVDSPMTLVWSVAGTTYDGA